MIHYPRETWQTASRPITGPPVKQKTTQGVVHWDGDDTPNGPAIPYLRRMQDAYVVSRGYSVGYWQYIEQDGTVWQIRGPYGSSTVYNSAANAGAKVQGNANDWTYPILFEACYQDTLTTAQCSSARQLWAEAGITSRPIPHSTIDYTACPGDLIRAQIAAGALDPAPWPPPTPETPTMLILEWRPGTTQYTAFITTGTHISWLRDGHASAVYQLAKVPRVTVGDDQIDGIIRSAQTTTPPPGTFSETRRALWNSRATT